jgi:hypothetical protein
MKLLPRNPVRCVSCQIPLRLDAQVLVATHTGGAACGVACAERHDLGLAGEVVPEAWLLVRGAHAASAAEATLSFTRAIAAA